jgi:hypothetical protein
VVETSETEVTIDVQMTGLSGVVAGFDVISQKTSQVAENSVRASGMMDLGFRRLAFTTAGMIMNTVQLGDLIDRMARGQIDAGRAAILFGMNMLQLAGQIWTVVHAENARAIAHAIANALSGPVGWALLAGAAVAAGVGLAMATQIPKMHSGGIVPYSGIYELKAGEEVRERPGGTLVFNVYGNASAGQADEIVQRLRSAGYI